MISYSLGDLPCFVSFEKSWTKEARDRFSASFGIDSFQQGPPEHINQFQTAFEEDNWAAECQRSRRPTQVLPGHGEAKYHGSLSQPLAWEDHRTKTNASTSMECDYSLPSLTSIWEGITGEGGADLNELGKDRTHEVWVRSSRKLLMSINEYLSFKASDGPPVNEFWFEEREENVHIDRGLNQSSPKL